MTRRTVASDDIDLWDAVPEYSTPDPREYVSVTIDGSAFERLLWREVTRIIKRARLTDWQEVVFVAHLRGLSLGEIGALCNRSKSTVQTHLDRAWQKCLAVPHRGVLTVMIEAFGWQAVRDHLAEKLELRIRKRARE